MKLYSESVVKKLQSDYEQAGGEVITFDDDVFHSGVTVMKADGYKTAIIKQHAIWNRLQNDIKGYGYNIRFYNRTPKKYARALEIWKRGAAAFAEHQRPNWAFWGAMDKALSN